ncbi:MAG: nitroreductase family protein [Candidatus Nealsonbacteria bacterium]
MELEEVLKNRHSIRKFQKKDIPDNIIKRILGLANLSPSAGNLQARSVVIVKDEKIREKISEATMAQHFVAKAPVVFVICANLEESAIKYGKRGRELYAIQDATIFASYLQLAVTLLKLSSCWVGAFNEDKIKKILDLPEQIRPVVIMPTGFADEQAFFTGRKGLDEIIKKHI